MAKKKRKGSDKKHKGSCPQPTVGYVIKVPEGAVLRGCKKTRRKLREHLRLRAEIHSQLRVIASLLVLRIFLTCLVGYPTPGFPSAPQPPAVQPPQPPDAPPLPPLRGPDQPAFEDPSNQALLDKLQELGSINLAGVHNTIDAHSMQLAVAMQQHYSNPGKERAGLEPPAGQVEPRLVRPAWSQERGQPVRGLVWCPVVAPRKPPQAPRSGQAATQPAASEPGPSTPPPAKRSKPAAEPTKGKGKGKAAKAKPAPQPGRWLDRDCNAALNMQRSGESRWRPLELCYWPDQGALPAKGKEYPGLGYKRLRDKPPKAQEQQQQPAEAQ
ncbi:hypothetical protein QJQ45_001600 [Haematococcus lacustris]|nr:hypothetical protein QJQ45_001600 [Haematococcus lacustris]